jgi:ABC-2 type transport system ATP-binding protein
VAVIEVEALTRHYRTRKGLVRRRITSIEALRGVDFSIEEGELFGLLGPNGAGKTTTIKILTTLLLPTSGSARVAGFDPAREAREVRRRIGYVFGGDRGLYDRLNGLDNLRYFADLYRVPAAAKRRRIDELLALVGLTGRERERVETYSRGMRQRLHIARGLLHDPAILFLDEPTIGLDPVGALELRTTIGSLRDAGKTILLTTHYMFEADALCDRLAVIAEGRIVATGTARQLKQVVSDRTVIEVETFGGVEESHVEALKQLDGVKGVTVDARDQTQMLLIQATAGAELVQQILARVNGVQVGKVFTREPTLEDAYIELIKVG